MLTDEERRELETAEASLPRLREMQAQCQPGEAALAHLHDQIVLAEARVALLRGREPGLAPPPTPPAPGQPGGQQAAQPAPPAGAGAGQELHRLAAAKVTQSPSLTYAAAMVAVCRERPGLYLEHTREATVSARPTSESKGEAGQRRYEGLQQAAARAGLPLAEYLRTPEGTRAYASYTSVAAIHVGARPVSRTA